MMHSKIILSLFLFATGTIFASVVSSPESDLQGYLADTNTENSKFLTVIKKAGDNQAAITTASQEHAKALRAIQQKHRVGLQEYYKSAYQEDKAKQEAWRTAEAALKKQYGSKLGVYWKQLQQVENAYRDSAKALRAEYDIPLKEYQAAHRKLIEKYW